MKKLLILVSMLVMFLLVVSCAPKELTDEELEAEAVVHAFGGRFLLDDRGNALPIDADGGEPAGVPAAFYKDD